MATDDRIMAALSSTAKCGFGRYEQKAENFSKLCNFYKCSNWVGMVGRAFIAFSTLYSYKCIGADAVHVRKPVKCLNCFVLPNRNKIFFELFVYQIRVNMIDYYYLIWNLSEMANELKSDTETKCRRRYNKIQ